MATGAPRARDMMMRQDSVFPFQSTPGSMKSSMLQRSSLGKVGGTGSGIVTRPSRAAFPLQRALIGSRSA